MSHCAGGSVSSLTFLFVHFDFGIGTHNELFGSNFLSVHFCLDTKTNQKNQDDLRKLLRTARFGSMCDIDLHQDCSLGK